MIGTLPIHHRGHVGARHYHTVVLKEANRNFHMCAQDVQITRTTNSKVNSLQCYDYNINRVYLLQNDPWIQK
jgi:hypothetical protein